MRSPSPTTSPAPLLEATTKDSTSNEPESRPVALVDWAYRSIKDALLALEIPPGAQLCADELAQRFGVSRTPVREALLRLEQDGLVRTVPRVGTFAAEITASDLQELFELRELLEVHCAKKAATSLSEEDLKTVDRLIEQAKSAVDGHDPDAFQRSEIEFHELLLERAGNRRLLEVMSGLHDLTHRQRVMSLGLRDNIERSLVEHVAVAEALRKRSKSEAGRLMGVHIRAVRDRLLAATDLPP